MDVIDFAMRMELDGKAHYKKLEEMTPVPRLKKLFAILAVEEENHYEAIKGMKSGIMMELTGSTALETAQNLFQTIRIEETLLAELRTKLDAYRYAIKIESDSIELYEGMLKQEETKWGPAEVALLLKIIEEEKKHYTIMENIHDLIAKNRRLLAWRDFNQISRKGIVPT